MRKLGIFVIALIAICFASCNKQNKVSGNDSIDTTVVDSTLDSIDSDTAICLCDSSDC